MAHSNSPRLRCYFNWLTLNGLPPFSGGPLEAIQAAGYDGVQFVEPLSRQLVEQARSLGLGVCGSGRVNEPRDAEVLAREAQAAGLECLTLHVGWGLEDDDAADSLIAAVLSASIRYQIPLYPETHRATIFQDMWRTVGFIRRFPTLEFNCDFSHWYTGLEMVYGGFGKKVEFIRPIIERGRFIHGRIGNPGSMQVPVGDASSGRPYVEHFRTLWTEVFVSFLQNKTNHRSPDQSSICFTTELLAADIFYARTFSGHEESDRWEESKILVGIARECFSNAETIVAESR
jgi:hypothetical protein